MGQVRVHAVSAIVVLALSIVVSSAAPTTAANSGKAKGRVAGTTVSCKDFIGRTVQLMRVSDLGDVARAWVVNRMPFIIMDRERLAKLPPKLQLFFYDHECAHHEMGHWMNTTIDSEREADCMAIRKGRDSGLFTREEVISFAPFFKSSKGSRYGHLPGPLRAKFLVKCFDTDDTIATKYGERNIVSTSARE